MRPGDTLGSCHIGDHGRRPVDITTIRPDVFESGRGAWSSVTGSGLFEPDVVEPDGISCLSPVPVSL